MKKKNVGKALVLPLLAAAAFASIGVGTTFALFTSEAKAEVSVTAGKIRLTSDYEIVGAYSLNSDANLVSADHKSAAFANGGTAALADGVITLTNVTPGDKIVLKATPTVDANVKYKWRMSVKKSGELAPALTASLADKDGNAVEMVSTDEGSFTKFQTVDPSASDASAPSASQLTIEFPDREDNNDYQEKKGSVVLTYEAYQGNADIDDAHNPYELDTAKKTFNVYTVGGLQQVNDLLIQGGEKYQHYTVKLNSDIHMDNIDWKGLGGDLCYVNFDGGKHTIYNLKMSNGAGFINSFYRYGSDAGFDFAIKNVTFDHADVTCTTYATAGMSVSGQNCGIVIGDCNGLDMEYVTVQHSKLTGEKNLGGLVGYYQDVSDAPFKMLKCKTDDVTITASQKRVAGLVAFIGAGNSSHSVDSCAVSSLHLSVGSAGTDYQLIGGCYNGTVVNSTTIDGNKVTALAGNIENDSDNPVIMIDGIAVSA